MKRIGSSNSEKLNDSSKPGFRIELGHALLAPIIIKQA